MIRGRDAVIGGSRFDFLCELPAPASRPVVVAVECKYLTRRFGSSDMARFVQRATEAGPDVDRALIVTNLGFTAVAKEVAKSYRSVELQLLSELEAAAQRSTPFQGGDPLAGHLADLMIASQVRTDDLPTLFATIEPLLAEVRRRLLDDEWSAERGFDLGLQEDIEGDLNELERQLRPLSERPISTLIIQGHVARLSGYLVDLAERIARAETKDRIESLRHDVIDRVEAMTGSADDIADAVAALKGLAFVAAWEEAEQPPDSSDADWELFVQSAEENPARAIADIIGWTSASRQQRANDVLGGLSTASAIGFFVQNAAAWISGSTGAGVVAALLSAPLSAVLGVLAVRYVRSEEA